MKINILENGIAVTRDMTAEEEAEYRASMMDETALRVEELKRLLAESDYKAIKYAEGVLSEEEYAPVKAQRQAWREEINGISNGG